MDRLTGPIRHAITLVSGYFQRFPIYSQIHLLFTKWVGQRRFQPFPLNDSIQGINVKRSIVRQIRSK